MRLPKYAIDNHQFTIIVTCLLVLVGIVSFITMPKSEDPAVQPAGSSVIVIYPGASPADIEQLVIEPLEEAINELEDIREIVGTAEDGIGIVAVEFFPGSDPDDKYADVLQKVNSMRSELPENIIDMETIKWSISDVDIYQFGLVSDIAPFQRLEDEAERLKKLVEVVSGVKRVQIWALPEREVRVSVDLEKLAALRIPLTHVMGAIQDANTNIPGGHLDIGDKRLSIKTSGSYQTLDDIRYTLIHSRGGKAVYVKDIADVAFDEEDQVHIARVNGRRSIFVTANQKPGTNIFEIDSRIKKILHSFKTELPDDIELHSVFDQSESVSHRIKGFFGNLSQGIFLVGIVIFTVVSWRAALIVMLVIPISNLIGIACVDLNNFGLEQMTIAGLVIALGLLVDNAIVVTENITRYMKMGFDRKEAALKGTSEVGWAVASATATTVFAFIPIILMEDVTGDFIRSMPVTVVFTLTASLLISLTLTPYLSSRFLVVNHGHKEHRLKKLLNRFVETRYRRILTSALARPGRTVIIAFSVFLLSLGLFPFIGTAFFPKAEKPQFLINIRLPEGTSIDRTALVADDVEAALHKIPEISHFATNIGHGNPRIYYNIQIDRNRPSLGQMVIQVKEKNRKDVPRIVNHLRAKFENYPGARIEVKELEQGPPVEAPVAIRLRGENLDVLKNIAEDVESIIDKEDGTLNVFNPLGTTKSDLKVRIHRAKANMLGVPLTEIDRTIRTAMTGLPVTEFRDSEGNSYDIVLRLPIDEKPALSDFDRIHVSSINGSLIPLKHVATLELSASPLRITHYNMDRSVTVIADVARGFSVSRVTGKIMNTLDEYEWPRGYSYDVAGELANQEESFGGMGRAAVIAIIAIFGVLVLQFRSYSQPFIVFSAIPMAVIGSLLALFLTGNPFSFTAFIGACSLIGIVVNNSIILVDYANQLRREGLTVLDALKKSGETRFVPIILTTTTTIGGLLPLTIGGGSLWAPMGWTIIGGLLVSTFLTLVIVPVLYKLFTRGEV